MGSAARFTPCAAWRSTLKKGQFFTLLGPSGCRKTITLRCLAGLETPSGGRITIETVFDSATG